MRLWQTQLNFVVWCASSACGQTQLNFVVWCALSACGVSSVHLNYTKHPMVRAVYHFHVYCHVRRNLKRLQVPLPDETGFNAADNPYTESEFLKICEDYRVPNDPINTGINNFIGPISMVFIGLMIILAQSQ